MHLNYGFALTLCSIRLKSKLKSNVFAEAETICNTRFNLSSVCMCGNEWNSFGFGSFHKCFAMNFLHFQMISTVNVDIQINRSVYFQFDVIELSKILHSQEAMHFPKAYECIPSVLMIGMNQRPKTLNSK